MINYKLKQLVIKPTLACTANCATCASRRELHKDIIKEKQLTLEDWKKILSEASALGVERFDISGGEPTLYKNLVDLVKIGKSYGWYVNINTNGSLISKDLAERLLSSGVNSISVSLYSSNPEVHDGIRRSPGLWINATNAIRLLSSLEKKYPDFRVRTQTLFFKENYKEMDQIMKLHYELGSFSIALTYLEGDFEKKYLMNEEEITYFKNNVLPKMLQFCKTLNASIREEAANTVEALFSEQLLSNSQWAKGIYRPKDRGISPCTRPQNFTILLANGDVHPCNMIEYSHQPVMGNLFENSLTDIWNNKKWNNFRERLFDKCEICPINLYMCIPLRPYILKKSLFERAFEKIKF